MGGSKIMTLKISDEAKVQMPMKTVASLITLVAIGTWAYFGINEKLNQHSTKLELFEKDLEQNSEFRIKYPRGDLGQSSGEAELFMLVEMLSGEVEQINDQMKDMMSNTVNVERLQKDVEKMMKDIEKLKDKQRTFSNGDTQ
jgi:succinate dehydrogenase/fumarate reductase flavoprotein subunit